MNHPILDHLWWPMLRDVETWLHCQDVEAWLHCCTAETSRRGYTVKMPRRGCAVETPRHGNIVETNLSYFCVVGSRPWQVGPHKRSWSSTMVNLASLCGIRQQMVMVIKVIWKDTMVFLSDKVKSPIKACVPSTLNKTYILWNTLLLMEKQSWHRRPCGDFW
jgi:hypothetical protein